MKLFTLNLMECARKGCQGRGFPLELTVTSTAVVATPENSDFIRAIISRLDWPAFVKHANAVCLFCK